MWMAIRMNKFFLKKVLAVEKDSKSQTLVKTDPDFKFLRGPLSICSSNEKLLF